jgi:hypothetical protein
VYTDWMSCTASHEEERNDKFKGFTTLSPMSSCFIHED